MPPRTRAVDRGTALGRRLVSELCRELETGRLDAGLSYAEIGRAVGISGPAVAHLCQGQVREASVVRLAQLFAVVGMRLAAKPFPDGAPIRDRAHLALLERFRRRLHPSLYWRIEVPVVELSMAGAIDHRSWDGAVDGPSVSARVEAETHAYDAQALERRIRLKQRDGAVPVVVLLLSETRHHRTFLDGAGSGLRELFPVSQRTAMAALSRGRPPGGNAIVLL